MSFPKHPRMAALEREYLSPPDYDEVMESFDEYADNEASYADFIYDLRREEEI